jgi:hypothetical protein
MWIAHTQVAALVAVASFSSVTAICDICGVRYEGIKDYSTPFESPTAFPTCNYYREAACCNATTVQEYDSLSTFLLFEPISSPISHSDTIYGLD